MPQSARKTAYDILLQVEGGKYSNLLLQKNLGVFRQDQRERAFCSALVLTTLSRRETLDELLRPFCGWDMDKLDSEVRTILRMGACQLKFMDSVPSRAAVSESVELCKNVGFSSASRMVNAVLRNADKVSLDDVYSKEYKKPYIRYSVKYSVCRPLAKRLMEDYPDKAQEIGKGFFQNSETYVRVNTLKANPDILCQENALTLEKTNIPGCLRVNGAVSGILPLIENGTLRIQSKAAQTAALMLDARPGMSVLDMCAAPGGKTLTIAQQMNGDGSILACDVYEGRLSLIEKQAFKEGVSIIKTKMQDASLLETEELYDRVLCDVPCSGYGEIASKPELRYKHPEVSSQLPQLQYEILCRGAGAVKPGGKLVYSTCTILKAENEEITEKFLSEHKEFDRNCEDVKFLPGFGTSEGFYIASFVKKEQ